MFPKIVGWKPPNHPFVHKVFHDFHHPFWGFSPYFWKHPYISTLILTIHILYVYMPCGYSRNVICADNYLKKCQTHTHTNWPFKWKFTDFSVKILPFRELIYLTFGKGNIIKLPALSRMRCGDVHRRDFSFKNSKNDYCTIYQIHTVHLMISVMITRRWRSSNISYFHPEIWGRFPFWQIFFRWVETTNQIRFSKLYSNGQIHSFNPNVIPEPFFPSGIPTGERQSGKARLRAVRGCFGVGRPKVGISVPWKLFRFSRSLRCCVTCFLSKKPRVKWCGVNSWCGKCEAATLPENFADLG